MTATKREKSTRKSVPDTRFMDNIALCGRAQTYSWTLPHRASREEFADPCGLDRTYIGGIERGERNVARSVLDSRRGSITAPLLTKESRFEVPQQCHSPDSQRNWQE